MLNNIEDERETRATMQAVEHDAVMQQHTMLLVGSLKGQAYQKPGFSLKETST